MRKYIIILLAILFAFSAAAESDMSGLATEDLITLRDAINHELALRSKDGTDAQVVDVDGILFTIDSVYIGTGNDDVPAICILFSVSNTSDASKQLMYDIGCDILQDGILKRRVLDAYTQVIEDVLNIITGGHGDADRKGEG